MMRNQETYLVILEPSGIWRVEPHRADESLKQLQGIVEGLVDCVETPIEGCDAWVNDEFLFMPEEKFNAKASVFLNAHVRGSVAFAVCDPEGHTVGMNHEGAAKLIVEIENKMVEWRKRICGKPTESE